jgi:hypothetical protein
MKLVFVASSLSRQQEKEESWGVSIREVFYLTVV